MAQVTTVTLIDDLDGKTADETVSFSLDGIAYEVDLGGTNARALRMALAPFIAKGRRTGGKLRKSASKNGQGNPAAVAKLTAERAATGQLATVGKSSSSKSGKPSAGKPDGTVTTLKPRGQTAKALKAAEARKAAKTVSAPAFSNAADAEASTYVGSEVKLGHRGNKWWTVKAVTDADELHCELGDDEKFVKPSLVKAVRVAGGLAAVK